LVGLLAPLGLIIAYIVLDPRIRLANELREQISVPVLAVIPHQRTVFAKRMAKSDVLLLAGVAIVSGSAYLGLAYAKSAGFILGA
jgi:hypothetical protein